MIRALGADTLKISLVDLLVVLAWVVRFKVLDDETLEAG